MNKLRKAFVISVMFTTVLSMSVVVAPEAGATASAGDLIKMDGLSSVYYLGSDNKRYVFPNEQTYFSWYSDFSSVVTIPQSELESYSLGANVTIRPGTKLVKITTDPKVYAVESDGTLLHVPSEATAIALYGAGWASRVIDVPDAFFTNYTVSSETVSSTAYPEGSLVKFGSSADVYYIDAAGSARKVADEAAFTANRFNWNDVITSTMTMPTAGTEIAGAESTLIDTSSGAGGVAGAGTGLTVSLSSATKAASNIPAGSPSEFLTINLTASNDGDVNVTALTLQAYDLGTATYIDSVTIYDNGVKQGTSKNVNSDRVATFNFPSMIKVAAGTTKSLVVKATIQASQTGNFALGVVNATGVGTNGAAVSGSFPIVGNTQAIVSGTTIGTMTMSNVGTTDTTNNFGEDNVLLASFDLTSANEAVLWESVRLKNGGTNTAGLVGNLRLLIDGDEVVSGVEIADKFATFNLNNRLVAKNDTISVEIYGDLGIGNVSNTVDLYFDDASDLVFTGQDYGYGITIASITSLDAVSDGIVSTLAAGDVTIDFNKSTTPSKDVRPADNDVVFATLSVVSAGENATITAIGTGADTFYVTGTGLNCNELENMEMRDTGTGAVYDMTIATSTGTATYCALTLTDEISLVKGVTRTYQIRGDVQGANDTNTADNSDTYQVVLTSSAFTIAGDESNSSLQSKITPSSISSAIATVKTATLGWTTTSLTNKTIVPGTTGVAIYRATLETGASSYVDLTSVKISASSTGLTAFDDNNIAQLRLYVDGKLAKTSSSQIVEGTASAAGYINFISLDTTNRRIAAGKTVTLEVQADFAGSFNPTGWIELLVSSATADIVAKDQDSNAVVESIASNTTISRRVILASTGTLKVELKTTDSEANDDTYILAGTSTRANKYLGELEFTTANEPIKIKTLVLGEYGSSTSDDIATVNLYNSAGTIIASKVPAAAGHVNFDTLNITLPADQTTSWYIGVTTKTINADGDPAGTATFGREIQYSLASTTHLADFSLSDNTAVTAVGGDSGNDITIISDVDGTLATSEYSASTTLTKLATTTGSILTSVTNAMSNGTLTGGSGKIIAKYKFTFDNGTNRNSDNTELKAELNSITLSIASSSTSSIDAGSIYAYLEGDSSNKTNADSVVGDSGSHTVTIALTELSGTTELVDGEVTLVVEGDITTTGTSQYIQTEIANLTSHFTYNGNNANTGMDWSNQSSDLGISRVVGGTLSN